METEYQNKKFNELTEDERKAAYDKWLANGAYSDYDWSEGSLAYYRDVLENLGFYDLKFGYSISSSQGDGACFEGKYLYAKGAAKQMTKDSPNDEDAIAFGYALQDLQRRYFYNIYAQIRSNSGNQSHEHSVSFYLDQNDPELADVSGAEEEFTDLCRGYMRVIFKQLEKEYEDMGSEESFKEMAEANQWEFDEMGKIS